jgi:transcriptional regulator GlxA family with amidase domain
MRVALALLDDMPPIEVALVREVFGTPRRDLADPWYELTDDLNTADTVIVPALPYSYPLERTSFDPWLIEALQEAHLRGARVVSLCTGAFALAEAGLLDGRRATTHWMHAGVLSSRYPKIEVDPAVLYIDNGDVLTSAGRMAGLDLCLHLVRKDLGVAVGNQLARRMVAAPHRPGGQAQYIETPLPRDDHGLAEVLNWALRHLNDRLTVREIAARAGLSTRTLIRRFHETTGTTPLRWLHEQRLARARELLETTDLTVDRISGLCGLGTAANLRHHFMRTLGVTPSGYRRTFCGDQDRTGTGG